MTQGDVTDDEDGGSASLAAAIRALRRRVGSHDKLAERLGTTRQTIIRWEHGAFPKNYVLELEAEGVARELLMQGEPRAQRDRLAALEAEVARLKEERDSALEAVVVRLAEIEAALENAGLRSARQSSARGRRR